MRHSLLLALWISGFAAAAQEPCLTLAFPSESPNVTLRTRLVQAIYDEAALCVAIKSLPSNRIEAMIRHGELDGEVLRVQSYLQQMPELIAIPTPVTAFIGRLYWPAGRPQPTGQGQPIGQPRGWKWAALAARPLDIHLIEVSHLAQLFDMTRAGRIEGFLMSDYDFKGFVAAGVADRPFASVTVWNEPMLHAVTRIHADLVPRLDAAIRRLAERGDLTRLTDMRATEE